MNWGISHSAHAPHGLLSGCAKKFSTQNKYFEDLLAKSEKSHQTFTPLDFAIKDKEIMDAIKHLKNNKSAGLDGIRNEMLKTNVQYILPFALKLFNIILSSGKYPKEWKTGFIRPIHKNDSPHDPSNYRGITITSCLSKVFNSILNTRLQNYLDSNNIINKVQIGFQPKARTSDHMFVLRTLIQKYTNNKSKLYVCFINFSKAFDTVLHSALLYRLRQIDIKGPFYRVIKDMYMANSVCETSK